MPLVRVPRRRRRPCLEVNTVRPKVALSRPKLTKLRYVKIVMFDEMEKCREARLFVSAGVLLESSTTLQFFPPGYCLTRPSRLSVLTF